MITLPVSSSVYQSMVANIQQIHTNGDGTLCITPMQVQKSGHQHSINHINSTSISGSLIGNNCSVTPCISSVNSSYSNVSSVGPQILANCQPNSNGPFATTTSELSSSLNCDSSATNSNNNLLELCRVLSQSTTVSNSNCQNPISFNNNVAHNFPNGERKPMKSKKIINRNQFFNATNFGSSTSFANDSNGIERSFVAHDIDGCKAVHESDTNNNNNNNHNEGNNGNVNHDLKCAQILVSTVTENPMKPDKSENVPVAIQPNEIDNRTIKMECEIDAA